MRAFPVLALLLACDLVACSADPRRERVWAAYQRDLVSLEAGARDDQRLALARRGLADPQVTADERCRLHLEAARALQAQDRVDDARAEVAAARRQQGSPECTERADLLDLRLAPAPVSARAFLVNHPASSVYAAVLGDLLHGLEPAAALAQLADLVQHTDDPAALCVLRLERARRLTTAEPEAALALYDQVAAASCARSADAAVSAIASLATLGRFAEVRARFDATTDEAVAWTSCRALERGPDGAAASSSCLQAFSLRFPGSRKVDDAWFLLAEQSLSRGDVAAATTLYRRIVDERPDAGRAAQAGRRLEELRSPARP